MPERQNGKVCCIKNNIITTARGTCWTASGEGRVCVSYEDKEGVCRRRKEEQVRTDDERAHEELERGGKVMKEIVPNRHS